jgi:hypothetical protein
VLESNKDALAFYERLGGQVAGDGLWKAPDGGVIPKLRVVWSRPEALLASAPVRPME